MFSWIFALILFVIMGVPARAARDSGSRRKPATGRSKSGRRCCFTWFGDVDAYFIPDSDLIKRAIYQVERCPHTARLHIQGYAEFTEKITFLQMKRLLCSLDDKIHITGGDAVRGTWKQNRDYCSKTESREPGYAPVYLPNEEAWDTSNQGKRNDLLEASKMLKEGKSMKEMAELYPSQYIRYNKGLEKLQRLYIEPRDPAKHARPTCLVYYGPTGTGKTMSVFREFGSAEVYVKSAATKWFTAGYLQQKCILLDDFDGISFASINAIPLSEMLTLLDSYPHDVEIKGDFVGISSRTTTIIITSNNHPSEWYPAASEKSRAALLRRVEIIEFPNDESRALLRELDEA